MSTITLTPGANLSLPLGALSVTIETSHGVDVSAYLLADNGKIRSDDDMVFYGQPCAPDGSVQVEPKPTESIVRIDTSRLHATVNKISVTLTCDQTPTIAQLSYVRFAVRDASQRVVAQGQVDTTGREEAALIVGELYRRNNEWKYRFVGQGFNGGLKPLAEHFGVTIEDEPAHAPTPPIPAPSVSLSKVSLTKENQSVSLAKRGDFGRIRVNLNWNQSASAPAQGSTSGGLFGGLRRRSSANTHQGIDLDLGAFVRYQDGSKAVIQALGDSFGDYDFDLIQLLDDDRTGNSVDGEWIHINGSQWDLISEVLIYTFIYEGVPSWNHTDGVVTIHVPNQAPIETRLTEGNNQAGMCAIARLVNDNGSIRVERINRYFRGHADMDNAFGWGFRWQAGSK